LFEKKGFFCICLLTKTYSFSILITPHNTS